MGKLVPAIAALALVAFAACVTCAHLGLIAPIMPFDLPPKARSPTLASSWQKALNYRDFQDKMLRVIQYSSRGIAFYLLRADPTHVLGTKLFNL